LENIIGAENDVGLSTETVMRHNVAISIEEAVINRQHNPLGIKGTVGIADGDEDSKG
jgi:hypothetical protein